MTEPGGSNHIVTNRARGKTICHAAAEVYVRNFPAIISDEPPDRLQYWSDLVARYCPVDSLIRAAIPDYHITWEPIIE